MFNKEQLSQMRKDNLKWPFRLTRVPKEDWSLSILKGQVPGDELIDVYRSRHFLVQVFKQQGVYLRLSIQRTEWDNGRKRFKDGITWDELMRLKEEAGYGDRCALEVYPPDKLVVNVANIRHLFLQPLGHLPNFVWLDNQFS